MILKGTEKGALRWLSRETGINRGVLVELLTKRESGLAELYRVEIRKKKDGGIRRIHIPCPELMEVQRKISKNLLSNFQPGPNAYGFFGGSVLEAIKPHLNSRIMFSLDLVDAFPSVREKKVFASLRMAGLGWYSSWMVTQLVTWEGALPQGAPTSPKTFDLCCERMDKRLSRLAEHTSAFYTRYTDNLYFSMKSEKIPAKIQRAILRIVKKEEFLYHKVRIKSIDDRVLRMLGLNIIDRKPHNTRGFNRNLRLTSHHLEWLDKNQRDTTKTRCVLNGQLSWAIKETLPPKLKAQLNQLSA